MPGRVPGLQQVVLVAVGEKHSLAIKAWWAPELRLQQAEEGSSSNGGSEADAAHEVRGQGMWLRCFCLVAIEYVGASSVVDVNQSGRAQSCSVSTHGTQSAGQCVTAQKVWGYLQKRLVTGHILLHGVCVLLQCRTAKYMCEVSVLCG